MFINRLSRVVQLSHPRPKRWSVRFELRPEVVNETRLREHLEVLAQTDEVSQWIRDVLIAALPSDPTSPTTHGAKSAFERPAVPKTERPFTPVPKPGKGK